MNRLEKTVLWITAGSHLSVHSLMLVLPNILLILQEQFSTGLAVLGLIATLSNLMFGLGALPAGYLESRLGGRKLLLIYQLGTTLSTIIIIFSNTLWTLAIGLMILGLFASIYHPAGLTLISRRIEKISKGMAWHGIAGSSGLALGPLLAAYFAETISWKFAFGVLGGFNLLLALLTLFFIPKSLGFAEDSHKKSSPETNKPALFHYYGIIVLMGFAYTGFTTFMPTHFGLETRNIIPSMSDTMRGGLFMSLVLISGIIGQYIGGKLGDQYRRTKIIILIIALNIPLLFILSTVTGFNLVIIGIFMGIVHFSIQPVGNSLIADVTHTNHRGISYGISFFLSFGVGGIAAGIGGIVAQYFSIAHIFPVLAIILIPALAIALKLDKMFRSLS